MKIITEINKRLESLEFLTCMGVRANQRFTVGDRVRFSAMANHRHIGDRTKGGVRTGTVTKVGDGWSVGVLLDGYKASRSYFHGFLEIAAKRPVRELPRVRRKK